MSSTILSSLGEPIVARNSLGIITDNWLVVRHGQSNAQMLVALGSIAAIRLRKTTNLPCLASSAGCLLMAAACLYSKEASFIALPFAIVGVVLFVGAQATRLVSAVFMTEPEPVHTKFATLTEVATLVTVIHVARRGKRWGEHPIQEFLYWVGWYALMFV